ncbi:unnamed protein product [Leptidea sinapis]|uniref:Uncharacterized protein n=1 Tax=Leptidea sinapis TaxID=189913 RepID=A0A5E4PYM7_9NEOP|nr:unnamed protein product [Leptidea sinapis]
MDKSLSDTDINLMGKVNKTPPNYDLNRKRTRDKMDDSISNQLDELKREMRQMLNTFTKQHGREVQQINITLKEMKQSNVSIENSIAFLTGQNEELHKKINL